MVVSQTHFKSRGQTDRLISDRVIQTGETTAWEKTGVQFASWTLALAIVGFDPGVPSHEHPPKDTEVAVRSQVARLLILSYPCNLKSQTSHQLPSPATYDVAPVSIYLSIYLSNYLPI